MNLIKGIFLLLMITGIILLVTYYVLGKEEGFKANTVYKYIPRTLEEEDESPVYPSEIFKNMFTQPSVWIDSINKDATRKCDEINKYHISQK